MDEAGGPVQKGDLVAGKYRVEERLGEGAMGVVYAARHEELDERVALKFLSRLLADDETARSRFQREAKNAFSLKSEHVARVFDVGRLESGEPFIVMEFLEGETLKRRVANHGALPFEEAITILVQACEGVAEAHGRGIVHRDLKPENVMLTKLGNGSPIVKVLDFGISTAGGPSQLSLTSRGQLIGTPRYMSPEQLDKTSDTTAESDVWSLGVIAFWLFSHGAMPYPGDGAEVVSAILTDSKPQNLGDLAPDIDSGLVKIVMKCLERKKSARYENADALRRALAPFSRMSLATAARGRHDPLPPTHRSLVSPVDAPTLEQAKSGRVVDAVVPSAAPPTERETDRAMSELVDDTHASAPTKNLGATLMPTTERLLVAPRARPNPLTSTMPLALAYSDPPPQAPPINTPSLAAPSVAAPEKPPPVSVAPPSETTVKIVAPAPKSRALLYVLAIVIGALVGWLFITRHR